MSKRNGRISGLALLIVFILAMFGCDQKKSADKQPVKTVSKPKISQTLTIISGSENKALEPLIRAFEQARGVQIRITYSGSVDLALALSELGDKLPYDAVWPANTLWLSLGDRLHVVKQAESIMRSPVVLGVKKSIVRKLGWIDKPVSVADVLDATRKGAFRFAMTSATQSNSGCSAFLGFLYAMAGSPDMLQLEHLEDPKLQENIKHLLSRVNRSSGSSGWLKETVVAHYDRFQAMINYEALIIEANQQLVSMGREPLYAIYPTDGMMIADSPLGYVDKSDPRKQALFTQFQKYLLSSDIQKRILAMGRRTGLVGMAIDSANTQVFNPEWGISADRIISPVPTPSEPVIRKALELYQTSLRKPSCTAYVVDVSGSMEGKGLEELKNALRLLMDPQQASRYLLQPSRKDIHLIIPFSSRPKAGIKAVGNSPEVMNQLLGFVDNLQAGGGTDIYAAVVKALYEIAKIPSIDEYFPAIILMTDGKSSGDIQQLEQTIAMLPLAADIPIFSITFGDADETQLRAISQLTIGRVFPGTNLVSAFRKAKGYN